MTTIIIQECKTRKEAVAMVEEHNKSLTENDPSRWYFYKDHKRFFVIEVRE